MICDAERSVALAGIMGGLNSEIFAGTEDVLVESAFFDPVTIRRTSRRLGLSTEASYRFERGIDIGGVTHALRRSMMLIQALGGGRVATGIVDAYPQPHVPPQIDLSIHKTNRILGTAYAREQVSGYLEALEMDVSPVEDGRLRVIPPSFRVDLVRDVDLMEEVARLDGYDNIPVTYPSIRPSEEGETPELRLRDQVRVIMPGLGFTEIITYSFISPASVEVLGADAKSPLRSFVHLLNPLSGEQSVMRTTLIPGLMATVENNIFHEETELKLFEWGKVFRHRGKEQLPQEKLSLAAVMIGPYRRKTWYEDERPVDFYDIKGAAVALLKSLGLEDFTFEGRAGFPGYDPEMSAAILSEAADMGCVGRVATPVMAAHDLGGREAFLMEVDVAALLKRLPHAKRFRPFAKFPPVYRDISILVERRVACAEITEIIKRVGADLVESVQVFDLYEGDKVGPSEKSLAFRVCYRSKKETLDGAQVNRLHASIIEKIQDETGGRLREG
jgi:phenylalanyl-tRNA synthetase beta chain